MQRCNQLAKRHADFDIFDNAMIRKVYLHSLADLVESAPDREVTKGVDCRGFILDNRLASRLPGV
ncbi:hypothetical protein PPS11_42469 [Pseudomonas putida S11]|nr:hypothetical protein PPS11_42469 [Pseudomonas putida S11]